MIPIFFLFQSLKAWVNTVWQSNYTLSNYDTFHTYTHSILSTALLIILRTVRYSHTFFLVYFRIDVYWFKTQLH